MTTGTEHRSRLKRVFKVRTISISNEIAMDSALMREFSRSTEITR